jgi:putative ABC transport system permease protein
MIRITIANTWAHKRRLIGTSLAVLLGVAFLSGTLVLGDSLRAGFDDVFTEANAGTDAVVRGTTDLGAEQFGRRGPVDEDMAGEIAAVAGVADVQPRVDAPAQIVGRDGDPLGGDGPPATGGSWIPEPDLTPWRIVAGEAPDAPGEVVIDRGSAEAGDLAVGDTTMVLTPEPVEVTVVGIASFGTADNLSGATHVAFTLDEAQRLLMPDGSLVTELVVAAEAGVGQDELVARLAAMLPDDFEAVTGSQLAAESNEDIEGDFLGFFEGLLLVFAGVALLVAAFSIYNTFSIIIAQRTRESALLRAVGASRRQILASIGGEAVVVGMVASVVGLAAGIGLAMGLQALLGALGWDLPGGGPVVDTTTVVAALVVGVGITMLASVVPAVRASRIPPVAALRAVATERTGRLVRRAVLGLAAGGAGAALVVAGAAGADTDPASIGLGSLLTIAGLVVLGPVVARPAAGLLGAPAAVVGRVTGRLARRNAMRNPRRTAATASALMIGLGVVTLFTVVASSAKAAIDETVSGSFSGDLVITAEDFSGVGLSPGLAEDLAALAEVEEASPLGQATIVAGGRVWEPTAADPATMASMLDIDVTEGSLADLGTTEVAVSRPAAEEEGWHLGDVIGVEYEDGAREELRIGAIYDDEALVEEMVLPQQAWAPHADPEFVVAVMLRLAGGVDQDAGMAAVQAVAEGYAAPDVQTRDQYIASVGAEIDQALGVVYALLALAVVIALMGIANTLSLAIHERTRELGLLRAVGQSRRQTRAMVRWEALVVAAFGAIGGVALGLFLGWGVMAMLADAEGVPAVYAMPPAALGAILAVGLAVGLVASVRPARRAARLDIVEAVEV